MMKRRNPMTERKPVTAMALAAAAALISMLVAGCIPPAGTGGQEIPFTKEGELSFLRSATGEQIARIDIEIADTPQQQAQGLMYRSYLPATAGMLFVFDSCRLQVFWMKNTFIPLDIIFIDDAKEIVHIERNAIPQSEALISSQKPMMYAVEVNAGYCDAHGIGEGDRMDFVRTGG